MLSFCWKTIAIYLAKQYVLRLSELPIDRQVYISITVSNTSRKTQFYVLFRQLVPGPRPKCDAFGADFMITYFQN